MQWRFEYMTYLRQRNYDLEQGRQEGREEKAIETAKNMLKMNLGTESQIAKVAGLSLEKVKTLAQQPSTEA